MLNGTLWNHLSFKKWGFKEYTPLNFKWKIIFGDQVYIVQFLCMYVFPKKTGLVYNIGFAGVLDEKTLLQRHYAAFFENLCLPQFGHIM